MQGPETERFAAIDIGTNSVRLLIAEVEETRGVLPQFFALRMTRVGEGLSKGKGLQPEPVARTLSALLEFRGLIEQYGANRMRVVATSAVREALNAAAFLKSVKDQVGFRVDVISGEEEACLSYTGACSALPGVQRGIVVDIGGGSTEFTYPLKPDAPETGLRCTSVPLGAVRLAEAPRLLSEILAPMKAVLDEIGMCREKTLIGVGGTITTLAAVDQGLVTYDPERVHGYRLTRAAVERILFHLAAKNKDERKQVPGLQPERADIIVAGTTILWAILGYLRVTEIIVSEADLLYGIILELS
ncbi:MAG: Ppx/GppA phosphatase family protein [Bacillota bacterium]|nr:Ppx/GppA phosphatase family protein [Bacillota bacterium]